MDFLAIARLLSLLFIFSRVLPYLFLLVTIAIWDVFIEFVKMPHLFLLLLFGHTTSIYLRHYWLDFTWSLGRWVIWKPCWSCQHFYSPAEMYIATLFEVISNFILYNSAGVYICRSGVINVALELHRWVVIIPGICSCPEDAKTSVTAPGEEHGEPHPRGQTRRA